MKKHLLLFTLLGAAMAPAVSADELYPGVDYPIYWAEGEEQLYTVKSTARIITFFGDYVYDCFDSSANIIWGPEGDVYLGGLFPEMGFDPLIKGIVKGDKIEVTLPQCVYEEFDMDSGEPRYLYATVAHSQLNSDNTVDVINDEPEQCTVTYLIGDDGTLTLELNSGDPTDLNEIPEKVIALVGDPTPGENYWAGALVAYQTYEKFDKKPNLMPEDAQPEEWAYDTYDGYMGLVQVAVDGNDLYIGGLYEDLPESCLKGTIDGNKVRFDFPQFIGFDPWDGMMRFFTGYYFSDETFSDFVPVESITMVYDPEAKTLVTEDEYYAILLAFMEDEPAYTGMLAQLALHYQNSELMNAAPLDPTIDDVMPYIPQDGDLCGWIECTIPAVNVNGAVMRTENMYYNLFFDGVPYVFDNEIYFDLLDSLTDMPYNYSDLMEVLIYGNVRQITHYVESFTTLGLQSHYIADDGNVYSSNIVYYNMEDPSGIPAISDDAKVVAVQYFNLQGQPISKPASGLCIKRVINADGTSTSTKHLVR